MLMSPYLTFDGNCHEAMSCYAEILGGEIAFVQKFGESPMADQFPQVADRVMHMSIVIDGSTLMGSDTAEPIATYQLPQGFRVQIGFTDFEKAADVFAQLAQDGKIEMPFSKTFWAAGFGTLRDRFNIPWMINCD